MMNRFAYLDRVTKPERAAAIKTGMALALSATGFEKNAQVTNILSGTGKGLIALSLITGVPLGILAHAMGQQTASNRRSEFEAQERIKHYRQAARRLESELAGA